jgi:hypothetical protein
VIIMRPIAFTHVSLGLCSFAAFLLGLGVFLGGGYLRDLSQDSSFDAEPDVIGQIQGTANHCWRTKHGHACRKVPLIAYDRRPEHGGQRRTFAAQSYPFWHRNEIPPNLIGSTVSVRYRVAMAQDEATSAMVVEWPTARTAKVAFGLMALCLAAILFGAALTLSPFSSWLVILRREGFAYWMRPKSG